VAKVDNSPWSEAELAQRLKFEVNPEQARAYCYAGKTRAGEWVLPFRYPNQPVNVTGIYWALKNFPTVARQLCAPDITSERLNYQGLLVNWALGQDWAVSK
jgi:hypothetical protein